jgi:hypothetical protein
MCELCDKETGRAHAERQLEQYERMAAVYRAYLNGRIKPHTEEFSRATKPWAKSILRDIVNSYL